MMGWFIPVSAVVALNFFAHFVPFERASVGLDDLTRMMILKPIPLWSSCAIT